MFTTGLMIFLGLALILAKLPRRLMLRALHHDVALDLLVSAVVLMVHFGTFSGVMAATVAGLLTSIATSAAKRLFGSHDGKLYKPGILHVAVK
jgi:nucleoside permease NupC